MNIRIANRSNAAPFTAIALSLALAVTAVHLVSSRAVPQATLPQATLPQATLPQATLPQAPMLASHNGDNVANMSASRKTRCIMPPALRTSSDL